jgi:hypothetical protein
VKQEWVVQVWDVHGAAISDAEVAFFAFDPKKHTQFPFSDVPATHAHKAGGQYEAKGEVSPTEGSWYLVVRANGKSPVVQPLTLKRRASGEFDVSFEDGLALTVSLHPYRLTVGNKTPLAIMPFHVCPSGGARPAGRAFWRGRCVQLTGAAAGSATGAAA